MLSIPFLLILWIKNKSQKRLFPLFLKIRIGSDLLKLAVVIRFVPFWDLCRLDGTNQLAAACQAII